MWPSVMAVAVLLPSYVLTALVNDPNGPFFASSFGQPGNATFDYVVIGGGTAGLTIAARLAANFSVAVIEAGGFYEVQNGNGSVIPALDAIQATGTDPSRNLPLIDWGFVTTPQPGANNRRLHYARGKTLGGSSARNYMVYQRGTNGSYQQWANHVGDQSYTFANLLPYFEKSCQLTPPNTAKRFANGTVQYDPTVFDNSLGGPLQVSWPNWAEPIGSWVLKGMNAIGLPVNPKNFNSGSLNGSAWISSTINPENEHRDSSQTSFLARAMNTTDILVFTESMAQRILFNANKTATGVVVEQGGDEFVLSARKEVILSAGAFQSPQMLMVSGVGPKDILDNYGIPVIVDLPGVGQNLQDQPLFTVSYRVNVETASFAINHPAYATLEAEEYGVNRTGPLTSADSAVSFEKLPAAYRANFSSATAAALAQFPADWPELEMTVLPGFAGYGTDFLTADPADGYNYASLAGILVAPLSRGNVTIASANASTPPVINPGWLTNTTDQQVALASFKRVRALWAAMPGVTIGPEYFPGTANVSTDAQIMRFIGEALLPLWHASATCAMGMANDSMAVVDSSARVFGVSSLRVVDASAFPFLPPGHPQSTVYMLAEKIADDILAGR